GSPRGRSRAHHRFPRRPLLARRRASHQHRLRHHRERVHQGTEPPVRRWYCSRRRRGRHERRPARSSLSGWPAMKPHLNRMLGAIVALTLVWGCALTKDRFRPIPLLGQTREQGLQDQQECNEIALVNKGGAVPASSAVGAMSAAAVGAGAGTATAIAAGSAL